MNEIRDTRYEIRVTRYELRVTSYKIRHTRYKIRDTSYKIQVTSYKLQVTRLYICFALVALPLLLCPCCFESSNCAAANQNYYPTLFYKHTLSILFFFLF